MVFPDHWPTVELAEVAETMLGKMLDQARPKGGISLPYLRNVNVQWGRIDADDVLSVDLNEDERDRFALVPGDLLVCEGGDIGRAAIWHGGREYMAFQKALHRVRSRGELDLRWLRYLLEHYAVTGVLAERATGSTILHLPQQVLRRLPVPMPPSDEQCRIVEVLEGHLSRLTAATVQLEAVRERLLAWKSFALDRLVREHASGSVQLADLVERVEAGRSFGGATRPAREDEWGIIKVSAMTWGSFKADENKAVPADKVDPRNEIKPGDVLISRANTAKYVGAPVLVTSTRPRLVLSDKSLRIIPRSGIDRSWLVTVLAARSTRRRLSRLATGTKDSMRNISQSSLLSIEVPVADAHQQRQIVDRSAVIEEASARLGAGLSDALVRAQSLRQSLLAAAFSGRLT